ncbi:glycosyltransferase family 4 protein [Erythrobacter sp. HL-111]|uniref:glycosyltransferase family 4 protein n=1 Tax=Erythrobacter sp. HL-111 TaxID=1798193 RepID=UPI0006D99267|nr:glycosyltransferase family 4 protein [Erythrobacter sp. HL-111]KPP95372.1 MAG: Glycosyltransferase [Erythrobacteraceae bacterium HL-111]SDS67221.1 Glycosyltransferase involved in cell wall bisynthesis [Erythrobacter sp. HL-111]
MRLVFINRFFHPDESATSLMLTDLINGLALQNPDMHVITAGGSYTPQFEGEAPEGLPERLTVTRLPTLPISNGSLVGRLISFMVFYYALILVGLREIRRGDVVVCLTDPPLVGIFAVSVARLKGAQVIHWVQDIYPETAVRLGFGSSGNPLLVLASRLRDWAWKRAAVNVVIGERMQDMLVSRGVEAEQVQVIQNWAGEDELEPLEANANPLRGEWGFDAETMVIGYSGNLGRAHDADTMLDAGKLLARESDSPFRLLFIGGGVKHAVLDSAECSDLAGLIERRSYRPRRELALSLNVPDVHWLSLEPDLEGLIVPSKFYGAAAVGKPIIFIGDTDGEVARLLEDAECGASFAKGDAQGVADYLASLAASPALRQRLGANARSYSLEKLPRSARLREWRSLVREVALLGAAAGPDRAATAQGGRIIGYNDNDGEVRGRASETL